MGNSTSGGSIKGGNPTKDYLKTLCGTNQGITGGAGTKGYDSLEEYGNSMFSKAKGELIRSIAKDVASVLKISSSFAESADLKDLIDKFQKVVPDPRQGRKIKVDKKIHIDVCKKLASAINKTYEMKLINIDDSAENICQSVSELLYSLFTGLHSEFITVSGDITRIMRNLNALQDYVDGVHNKLIKDLQEDSPGEASLVKDTYEALSREIRRQHAYLANLSSGVIGPVGSSLINLLEETKSMPGLTDDLRALTGSREFSDKLSHMMSGTSSVAHAAYLVDKALKQLGMSISEYKNTKNMKELRNTIYDKLVKKKPDSKEMNKLLIAADILYRNDLSHDDIADHLSSKKNSIKSGGFADMVDDALYRDGDSVFKGRRHADKRSIGRTLHKSEVYRVKLFTTLNQQIHDSYDKIITELYKIGKKIGGEIKITDTLKAFIRQLGYFSGVQPDRKDLHIALSGYRRDVKSEYVKHDFIKSLETLKDAADSSTSGTGGAQFKNISAAIHHLITVIDDFNTTFTKTLTEVHVENDRKYEGAGYASYDGGTTGSDIAGLAGAESTYGGEIDIYGGEIDIYGGKESDFKYLVTMKKAIREIEYYYKIANIKDNLKIASMQNESYTKDYENILGEECAMMIDSINAKYKKLTCEDDTILGTQKGVKITAVPILNCAVKAKMDRLVQPDKDGYWGAYVFILEYIRSSKVEMIEAAQALDLYLSKFTAQIQANPDDIKDFVKLLEQIEIVSKWFTDKSGDNLVHVFESFQNIGGVNTNSPLDNPPAEYTEHYYERIKGVGPGVWTTGVIIPTKAVAKEFIVRMEKSIKSMRALENIIATFSKLSNKSSGDEIHTFMSPGLIFKAFMKYTVATSIALGREAVVRGATTNITNNNYETWIHGLAGTAAQDANLINTVYLRPINGIWNVQFYFDPLSLGNDYMSTDAIFEMSIKSMISKVFTVVGAYSLYNRPAKDFVSNKALVNMPLRQIMGGGTTVKIIPDAVELYIRLTLLGEWYRELFAYKNQPAVPLVPKIIVSMIPSFDGIWADFVKVIFVDAANINDGGYTDSFTQDLINSINIIYTHYKSKYGPDTCTRILENFVAEVNLRYGLVLQDDINSYLKEKDKGLKDETYDGEDNVDYDILDSKDQFSRKSAPSDKFVKESYKSTRVSTLANKHFNKEIIKFREAVEKALDLTNQNLGKFNGKTTLGDNFGILGLKYSSVDDLVIQTVKRINGADSDDKKYKIVQNTILGVERYSDVDYDCMLMFHETVINPLTILYTVYKMINHFNKFANSLHFNVTDPSAVNHMTDDITQCFTALTGLPGDPKYRKIVAAGVDREKPYLYFQIADYNRYKNAGGGNTINFSNLVEDTINHLIYLTCDKNPMVEMYFSGDGKNRYPMLSFKNLEKYVIELLENVGESLNKLRKFIPHDIVARYEDNLQKDFTMTNAIPANPNVISLFYLKEHFVDRLIKNKYGGGLSDANIALKSIWTMATKQNNAGTAGFFRVTNATHGPYNNLIAKLVYWDSSNVNALYQFPARTIRELVGTGSNDNWTKFPINKTGITKQSSIVQDRVPKAVSDILLSATFSTASINGSPSEIYRDAGIGMYSGGYRGSFGFEGIYDYDNMDQIHGIKYETAAANRLSFYGREGAYGLVFKLNRLIYHYVNLFTDKTSSKIYLPLLEKFANGINAREIMKGEAIDDITRQNDLDVVADAAALNAGIIAGTHIANGFGNALFPTKEIDSKSVLFATLARAIRNIVNDKKTGIAAVSILMNAESNLLNISEYMKDIMTAYLPIFEKQLNIMVNQAELIKSLIENTKLKVFGTAPGLDDNANYNRVAASQVKTDGVALTLKQPKAGVVSEADSKGHFLTLLSSIIATSKSLQSCVKNVYKELADIPLYFETYQNSITDYKNRNGVLPLMPLSQVSHLLNNQHRLVPAFDMPVQASIDTNKFGGVSEPYLQAALTALNFNTVDGIAKAAALADATYTDALAAEVSINAGPGSIARIGVADAAIQAIGVSVNAAKVRSDAAVLAAAGVNAPTVGFALNVVISNGIANASNEFLLASNASAAALVLLVTAAAAAKTDDDNANTAVLAAQTAANNNIFRKSRVALAAAVALAANTAATLLAADDAVVKATKSNDLLVDVNTVNTIAAEALKVANIVVALAAVAAGAGGNLSAGQADDVNGALRVIAPLIDVIKTASDLTLDASAAALVSIGNTDALAADSVLRSSQALLPGVVANGVIAAGAGGIALGDDIANLKRYNKNRDRRIIAAMNAIIMDDQLKPQPEQLSKVLVKLIDTEIIMTSFDFAGAALAQPHPRHSDHADDDQIIPTVTITKWIDYIKKLAKSAPPAADRIKPPGVVVGPGAYRYKYYSCKGLIPHQDVGVGSDEFKFAYGTRGLLSDTNEPNVEMAPGVIGVLDIYNSKVGGAASYDKRKMVDSFVNSTHLLRFATDYIYHKTYLCNNDLDKLTEFYLVGTRDAVITPVMLGANLNNLNMLQHLSCQTGRHSFNRINVVAAGLIAANNEFFRITSNITLLTENDNYKQSVYRMLRCIIDDNLSEHMHDQDRNQLRIYNILDSNIVPINFHALQREIALVNIFNYSYTFDHMIKQFIGIETASRTIDQIKLSDVPPAGTPPGTVGELIGPGGATKIGLYPEDALVRILIQPQGKRYVIDYVNNIWKLMAGNDSLSLNRPKYLSDQLWNKVLLNSLYSDELRQTQLSVLPARATINVGPQGSNTSRTMQIGHMSSHAPPFGELIDGNAIGPFRLNYGFNGMTYVKKVGADGDKHNLEVIPVAIAAPGGRNRIEAWNQNGYARYQTILVRYIEWFVHLQRVMRLLMRDQLTWVNDPIVHKSNALSNEITEYENNNKFEISDFE
jgi:hypothetical protein